VNLTREEMTFLREGLKMRADRSRILGTDEERKRDKALMESIDHKILESPPAVALIYYDGPIRDAYLLGNVRLIDIDPTQLYWMSDFDRLIEELQALLPNDGVEEVVQRLSIEREKRLQEDSGHPRGFKFSGGRDV
jgi:hypothetical protein